jgi:hypothetical protein
MKVNDLLKQADDTYAERNKVYGDSYKEFGTIIKAFFPNGVTLNTVEDMNRWGVFQMMLSKIHRYAKNFYTGGHSDSLVDLSVYSAMLNELDTE